MTDQLDSLLEIFSTDIVEPLARSTGFIKRNRKITARDFLTITTFGLVSMKHPSLGAMVAVTDARFTREALHYRFNDCAVSFMRRCFNFAMRHKLSSIDISTTLLDTYRRILIVDSSSWDVSPKLQHLLPGSGGEASPANCKIQVGYDFKSAELSFFEMTPGNLPDNRYTDIVGLQVKPKDLLLVDLGYFKRATFAAVHQKQAFFLSRLLIGTSIFNQHARFPLDLETVLANADEDAFELNIMMGDLDQMEFPCRLICQRVDPSIAARRRARLQQQAKKKAARRASYTSSLPIGHC